MPKGFSRFTKSRFKVFLVFVGLLTAGAVIQLSPFFCRPRFFLVSHQRTHRVTLAASAENTSPKETISARIGSDPSENKNENSKATIERIPLSKLAPPKKQSSPVKQTLNYQRTFIFPKNWILKKQVAFTLSESLIGRLMNELDWPRELSLQDLYPVLDAPTEGPRKNEVFISYDIKRLGFFVPQSYLRALLYQREPDTYQISLVDHHFDLPPLKSVFSIRVSEGEALKIARGLENSAAEVWQIRKEWRKSSIEWTPTWKIQLKNSTKTFYVDVRNGRTEIDHTELGALPSTSQIFIRGFGNPMLAPPETMTSIPLVGLRATLPQNKSIESDDRGLIEIEESPDLLNYKLETALFRVSSRQKRNIDLEIEKSQLYQTIIMNPKKLIEQAALINAFVYSRQAQSFLLKTAGFRQGPLKKQAQIYVNEDLESCNAHYRNGVISFYQESEECRNTAFDTVIFHEFAHYIDDLYGGIQDIALSEGMGDVLATFISDQPLVGEYLYKTNSSALRSVSNQVIYDSSPSAQPSKQIYLNSQAWSGFAWAARQGLIEKYGPEEGKRKATLLFLTPLQTNAPHIGSAVAEVFARNARGPEIERSADYAILKQAADNHGLGLTSEIQ